jgi:uncharacterized protein YndB with AHSA1/START domain
MEGPPYLAHAPAAVWDALTDPGSLARWLMPNDFAPVVGHRFMFRTKPAPGFDGVVHCEVLAIEPQQMMRISWRSDAGLDTTLTWTLTPAGTGTRLSLDHDGFDADPMLRRARDVMGGGWDGHISRRLHELLATTTTH